MQSSDGPAVAGLFGLGPGAVLEGPVARGLQGVVWRLRTPVGDYAVKESLASERPEDARAPGHFQEAARSLGVPAPRIHHTLDGEWLGLLGGRPIRVYDWVDVRPLDRTLHPADVGSLLARLHSVEVPLPQTTPGPWFTNPLGATRWAELIERSTRAEAPFAGALAGLQGDLLALEEYLAPATMLQMCHLDLWADNIRVVDGGGLCVLDWENAGPGDPSHELAQLAFEFGGGIDARVQSLYAAYLSGGGEGRLNSPVDFAMVIAVQGHLAEMHIDRWLDPAADAQGRAQAEEGLAEIVQDPLTPAVVETILAGAALAA